MTTLDTLRSALAGGSATVCGLTESSAAWAAAALADGRGLVAVVPHEEQAQALRGDLALFLAAEAASDAPAAPPRVLQIPALDASPYAELSPDRDSLQKRMAALYRFANGAPLASRAVVLSAPSLLRRVVPKEALLALSMVLAVDDEMDRDATAERFLRAGYARAPVVEDAGTFALRGGVIDIFPPLYRDPVRIELFGDTIETLRFFDPSTQRTVRAIDRVHIHPVRETVPTAGADLKARVLEAADAASHPSSATRRLIEKLESGEDFIGVETFTPAFHQQMGSLADYLPRGADTLWVLLDPEGIARAAALELEKAEGGYRERLGDHKIAFPPAAHYLTGDELSGTLKSPAHRLSASRLDLLESAERPLRLDIDANTAIRSALERARRQNADDLIQPLLDAFGRWSAEGWRVAIVCDGESRRERLRALLDACGVALELAEGAPLPPLSAGGPLALVRGHLSEGFAAPADKLVLLTDRDIFGARRHTTKRQRAAAKRAREALLGGATDFSQLAPGDFLVHQVHGVGRYLGLHKLPIGGAPMDFLQIEYSGGQLYLPVYRIGEVQRYVGAEGHKPRIDKLGGITFANSRRKVQAHVRLLAEELLQLYAQRASNPGHRYPAGDHLFSEFEATFEFEETLDQERAIADVIADMESERPMDRLVCGDVGYGKTEVAVRALFKAVLGGKQVAMLAPTTVLVEQHFRNLSKRFEGWPVRLGRLSRFQPRAEQLATVRGLAEGTLDAVIGTHRLLSKDVRFADLGLVIIDEEQRFGVAHKERLKKMRTQVDVLTLTATPIPRTLHLAMTGLRDLSIIATPPADRRSVRTLVALPSDGVLREGIRRELSRAGQVFFVSPRIDATPGSRLRSLGDWAQHLRTLVPEARVGVAHGQMGGDELEKAMVGFVGGELDILVSTTIVESGLDISRANTMFIDRADRFGLAQLYQLRGRIGRSSERAFCYLLVPSSEKLTDDARRRLEALQRYTDLGAGFSIASQDLEIRGAGELLGAKQSGSIAAVGFDTYTAMLEEAVAELRGEEIHRAMDPQLSVDLPGYIPDDYVEDTGQRFTLYKRLAHAADAEEVGDILSEVVDRYGALPVEVAILGDLMILKGLARRLRVQTLDLSATRLTLALAEGSALDTGRLRDLLQARGSRYRLTPDGRLMRNFSREESESPLASARACLDDLLRAAPSERT